MPLLIEEYEEKSVGSEESNTSTPKTKTKTREIPLEPRPDGFTKDTLCYKIRFTDEYFTDYENFFAKMELYRQPRWMCTLTHKKGFSYEQALESERKVAGLLKELHENDEYLGLITKTIHQSTDTANALLSNVLEAFKKKKVQFKGCVTRPIIKLKIKDIASRLSFNGSPWIVNEDLVEKFGLRKTLPASLRMKIEEWEAKKIKKSDPGSSKQKKKAVTVKPKLPKYPMEDLLLPPLTDRDGNIVEHPDGNEFNVPDEAVPDLLLVWDFLHRMSAALKLSRFTLADLEDAVNHKGNLILMEEIHICLLETIRQDAIIFDFKEDAKVNPLGSTEITDFSLTLLEKFCIDENYIDDEFRLDADVIEQMKHKLSYFSMTAGEKLKVLRFLCEEAMDTSTVREQLGAYAQKMRDVFQRIRDQESDHRDIEKEELQELKEAKEKRVGKERRAEHEKAIAEMMGKQEDGNSDEKEDGSRRRSVRAQEVARQQLEKELEEKKKEFSREQDKVEQRIKYLETKHRSGKRDRESERKASFEVSSDTCSIRTEPLGLDREFRRYYWSSGNSGRLVVEEPIENEGNSNKRRKLNSQDKEDTPNGKAEAEQDTSSDVKMNGVTNSASKSESDVEMEDVEVADGKSTSSKSVSASSSSNSGAGSGEKRKATVRPNPFHKNPTIPCSWAYYSETNQIESLLLSLNTKGVREEALAQNITFRFQKMKAEINKRNKDVAIAQMPRRRSRRAYTKKQSGEDVGFEGYANSYRK